MAVKKKPAFKGKYPGPEALKGNKLQNAAYRKLVKGGTSKEKAIITASKKKPTSRKPKPSTTTPTTPTTSNKPQVPNPTQPQVYPGSNVATNSTGTIQLQTNSNIEEGLLEAEEERMEAEHEAALLESSAATNKLSNEEQLRIASNKSRGQLNAGMAYRGLRGTSAMNKKEEQETQIASQQNAINNQHSLALQAASSRRFAGQEGYRKRQAWANQARLEYTNERSRQYPTEGSSPIESGTSGVSPTTIPTAPPKPTPDRSIKPVTTPKFKGKYPGPDRFKGNSKKIAAYKAAKRKVGKR